ncbi:helix-turn-helix transcriptional regulator [Streptomyces sp. NPDC057287]|uniref:helix-turn-helix domain-containing protein n=1 Tax=Streptomyces sp. NPDC057287 TaxID=3346086 RepID=UPI00363717D7
MAILKEDAPGNRTYALTDQECALFVRLQTGPSNAELGEYLHLTERTVKFHLANIRSKLGGISRLQLCLLAAHHEFCLTSENHDVCLTA